LALQYLDLFGLFPCGDSQTDKLAPRYSSICGLVGSKQLNCDQLKFVFRLTRKSLSSLLRHVRWSGKCRGAKMPLYILKHVLQFAMLGTR
jgi:hypothetical protein